MKEKSQVDCRFDEKDGCYFFQSGMRFLCAYRPIR